MKRVFFALVVWVAMQTALAQEKGLHLTFGGGAGWTNFAYSLDGGSYSGKRGYGGTVGMQYFFSRHWGFSLAGEIYQFNTQSRYSSKSFLFEGEIDDEGDIYDLSVQLKNWKENQATHFVEVPLMLMFQHKFGKRERHGLYFGLGAKAQIPIRYSFERADGDVKVWAHYSDWNLPLGEDGKSVELPQHGYGTNGNRRWNGMHSLKTGFAAVGEFGFLFGLSPRVDLSLGVVADYGLTNISLKDNPLLGPISGKTQQEGSYVAENIYYNGILNSSQTAFINTMSLRGKVGLRIKLGKLKVRNESDFDVFDDESEGIGESRSGKPDTIYVHPVVVYLPTSEQQSGSAEKQPQTETANQLTEAVEEELIEPIYFEKNKFTLTAEAKEVLDRKAALLKKYPQAIISIIGYTCNIGSGEYNDKLSNERAEAAKAYLIKKGINPRRIVPIPQGMHNPTYPNTSEANRELNRRVDFIIHKD